ncbi:MAG: cation:proton antiporter [Povalibacter sp.]
MQVFEYLLILLVCAVGLTSIARRVGIPYPSLLALGGTALALLPNAPKFTLDPALMLALFVAPVLLDAAFDTSLRDLKRSWIPVTCLVIIAVGITTASVALLARVLIPEMPWGAAIALGAIVAPPDAAAATAVLRQLKLPQRMLTILEGESLLNDASALIIYRLAVSAVMVDGFSTQNGFHQAIIVLASVPVAYVLARITSALLGSMSDAPSSIVIQFVTTFGVWILADRLGLSAVVTVVAYAITLSRLSPGRTPASMRIPTYAVWETVVFVLNVLAFILIGLQLRPILGSLEPVQRVEYLKIAGLVLAIVVSVRIAWVFTYTYVAKLKTRFLGAGRWPGPGGPTSKSALVISWCGMRGIVTLATAYALPTATDTSPGFPYRDLILLCAFCVVVGTLVIQGLTLRPLISALHLRDDRSVENEVKLALQRISKVALDEVGKDDSPTASALREEYVALQQLASEDGDLDSGSSSNPRHELRSRVVAAQRRAVVEMRDSGEIGDDAFHRIEERLDWNEISAR